ncbi:hypothetical protein F2Q69_00004018 [Brassica cretica]|uniref:Uncharacterized protein n=1 Tax=Brassica cretica TaxID=69181 RepID=A0A8S9PD55_BRACR|nr:hypothetical protein F2Q69_00004018 [Brassica cretica]
MVVLRSPSDIPSSSATVLRSAPGGASSSTAAPSSPLKIPSSSTGAPSSLPDVPSSSATVLRSALGAASSSTAGPSSPLKIPSLSTAAPSSLPDVPSSSATVLRLAPGAASSSTVAPSSPLKILSSSTGAPSSLPDVPSSSATVLGSAPGAASSSTAAPSSPLRIPSLSTAARSSLPDVPSSSLVVLRSAHGVASSSAAAPSSSTAAPSSSTAAPRFEFNGGFGFDFGTSLPLAISSLPLSTEPCCDEAGLNSLDGEVVREQLSLLIRKMELADGRKSWSEIAESVIDVELGTLTGSEAEDMVSASLIEEGTGFLFDEHGTNLAVEPGVEGSRLSLTTLLIVPSLSSLLKKTMLETVREYEQTRLANSSQTKESSSETTSSSDGSSYSSSHSDEFADGADVDSESGNVAGNDRQDDVKIVGVEDDGALGSAGGEQNGTGDVNVDEESEQEEFDGDGDHAAIGDDEMGDRDGVDGRSDFSGERDDFSGEHDSFGGEQNGVSGSPEIDVVGDGSDDGDGGSDRRADVTDILRKIKQESLVASLADSLDAIGDPCVYLKKKKRVRKVSERPRSFIGPLVNHPDPSESFPSIVDEDTIKWVSANCCRNGVIEARIPGEDERPWTVPDGWLCVYDFWFTEYHLWFPLPRLLLAYCDEHLIALAQLTPAAI